MKLKRHNSFVFNIQNQLNVFEGLFEKTDKILSTANTSNIGSIEELKSCLEEIENQLEVNNRTDFRKISSHNNVSVVPPEPAIGSGAMAYLLTQKQLEIHLHCLKCLLRKIWHKHLRPSGLRK